MAETELYLKWLSLFIDILKIIFSLPVIAGALLFYFLSVYKSSLRSLIGRLSEGSIGSFKIKLENDGFQDKALDELHALQITVEEEKSVLLNNLFKKAKLSEEETKHYLQNLSEKDNKLADLKLTKVTLQTLADPELSTYLYEIAKRIGKSALNSNDPLIIQRLFTVSVVDLPQSLLKYLYDAGIIDDNSQLTNKGLENLKTMVSIYMCKKCAKMTLNESAAQNETDDDHLLCMECRKPASIKSEIR